MSGTHPVAALETGGLISSESCDAGAHRGNVLNELLDATLVLELRATTAWAGTQFDLNVLIDVIGLGTERAGMTAWTPGPLGRQCALLGLDAEKRRLAVRGGSGRLQGVVELRYTHCLEYQLSYERNVLSPQAIKFVHH